VHDESSKRIDRNHSREYDATYCIIVRAIGFILALSNKEKMKILCFFKTKENILFVANR